MNRTAIFFLILLRLAIGWHFFYEGAQKVRSVQIGKAETNKPFTSLDYFRDAPGPAGGWGRSVLGDPDEDTLALTALETAPEPDKDADRTPTYERTPAALRKRWEQMLASYESHYGFSEGQKKDAADKLRHAED